MVVITFEAGLVLTELYIFREMRVLPEHRTPLRIKRIKGEVGGGQRAERGDAMTVGGGVRVVAFGRCSVGGVLLQTLYRFGFCFNSEVYGERRLQPGTIGLRETTGKHRRGARQWWLGEGGTIRACVKARALGGREKPVANSKQDPCHTGYHHEEPWGPTTPPTQQQQQ